MGRYGYGMRHRAPATHISSHAAVAMLTASHCCVCRAKLTDAESVEHGIGPICSRRYYNPLHQPTDQDVKNALGLMAISDLPDRIVDEFVRVVNNSHANARLGCNVLVYWASCNYQDKVEVFKCSGIIRALGYLELADKLELDRTVASLRENGDRIDFYVADPYSFHRDLMRVNGVTQIIDTDAGTPLGVSVGNQAKIGHKLGWSIPKASLEHLECVLGIHYGGELACNDKGIFGIPRRRWWELETYLHPVTIPTASSQGIHLVLKPNGLRLEVHTPFLPAFKEELKQVIRYNERTWTGTHWEVDVKHRPTVEALVKAHFGVSL